MKTLFTFLLSGLVAISAMAADATSRVIVSFTGNRDYRVYIDGRSYGGTDRIYLNDIRPGRHTIEVYPAQNNRGRRSQAVQTTDFTVRPQYDLNIKVQPNGRLKFDEKRNNDRYDRNNRDWNNGDDRYSRDRDYQNDRYGRDRHDRNGQYGRDRDDRDDRYGRDRDDRDDRYDRQNGNGNWGNGDNRDWRNGDRTSGGYNDYSRAMSDADFNTLVQRIRSQWFGKMNTAREGINANYFTTYQVRQVLQIFNSENDRLELAKLSYRRVVDTRSFTQLYDLFSASGQAELDRYIRDNRY